MKALNFIVVFCALIFAAIVVPVMAVDETTCNTVPGDASGLAECATRHDNECYPGGVLYREENQDGCPSEWYWKAGWYLARVNDGVISRSDVPDEFASVLPPETEEPTIKESLGSCTATLPPVGEEVFESHWVPQPGQYSVGFITSVSLQIGFVVGPSTDSIQTYGLGFRAPGESVKFVVYGDRGNTILLTFPCTYSET